MEENWEKLPSPNEIAQINETINHLVKDITFLTNVVVAMQNQINVLEQRINRAY
jgi:hypothetical protein